MPEELPCKVMCGLNVEPVDFNSHNIAIRTKYKFSLFQYCIKIFTVSRVTVISIHSIKM